MRNLSQDEINLINSDLEPFETLIKRNGWMNDIFLSKYVGISIVAEEDSVLEGANGDTYLQGGKGGKRIVRLKNSILKDERKRARTLYHELGHGILGLTSSDSNIANSVLESIVLTKRQNAKELKEGNDVYLDGLKLLEEYLVEKFSIVMMQNAKGIPEPKKERWYNPDISGNYIVYATFDSNYGIFESLCDKFVGKTYGNLANSIKAGLSEEFFTGFFEKYDKVELMRILGNLGHIKRAIYAHAGKNQYQYNPEQIHEILDNTNVLIDNIQTRSQSHCISPQDVLDASRNVANNNPGRLSSGVKKSQGLFSRIFNRNKTQEK